jgi:arylsulfatase A-like enzyme
MNAIVVSFDRLPVGFLGCCGNDWIDTPNFDRLAAQSALFHQHFAEYVAPGTTCQAWWSGRYESRKAKNASKGRGQHAAASPSLPSLFTERGITFRLLVETAGDDDRAKPALFPAEQTECVRGTDGLDVTPDETPFFRLVARAQRDLRLLRTSRSEPWLLWIKSRGVPEPWLAPRAFATQFLEIDGGIGPDDKLGDDRACEQEEDDEPEEHGTDPGADDGLVEMSVAEFDDLLHSVAQLPEGRASRDELSGVQRGLIRKVFGGYVALLDAALGRLLDQIDQASATSPTLLIITAGQGLTVREPGLLLDDWERMADETVHTPLFVRPAGMNRGTRRQELVQPVDLFPTLADWFGVDMAGAALEGKSLLPLLRGEEHELRTRAWMADGQGSTAIRTGEFYLVTRPTGETDRDQRRLFAKPEDIWETNNVAAEFPDLADELTSELERFFADETKTA